MNSEACRCVNIHFHIADKIAPYWSNKQQCLNCALTPLNIVEGGGVADDGNSEVGYGINIQVEKSKKFDNREIYGMRFKSTILNICG